MSRPVVPILEVERLSLQFQTETGQLKALRDISFQINPGETFGLAGESGSGKSSLAYAVMNYMPVNARVVSGNIRFAGQDILALDEQGTRRVRGNRIAMVYQDPKTALNPSMRVGRQIAEVLELHTAIPRDKSASRALELLSLVNIGDAEAVANRYPHQLSGGMQQRVTIAMALACDPELLIMDEPTTGLDVTTQARIIDLVDELKTKVKAAILFITHDLGVIAEVSDRVGILYAGELVEVGPKEAIFLRSVHPYTRGLLGAVPSLEKKRRLVPIPGRLPDLKRPVEGCIFAPRCGFALPICLDCAPLIQDIDAGHGAKCHRCREVLMTTCHSEEPVSAPPPAAEEGDVLVLDSVRKYHGQTGAFARWLGRKDRPVKAVDGVSFEVRRGEVFALVGESGCGKTTLGQSIVGLQALTDGNISFSFRKAVDVQVDRRAGLPTQMVFQHPDSSLNPTKTIQSILERPLKLARMASRERFDRVCELLERVNLDRSYTKRYPHELSGGEKQRVAIARAFALNPEFVLLDEPVSALDVSVQAAVINLLTQLRIETRSSYLFISHDLALVRIFADRIAVMYLGRVCELGPAELVLKPPYHPYTRALLSAVPVIDPTQKQPTVRLEGTVPSPRQPPTGCRFHTRCPHKIGNICEEIEPQLREVQSGHWISCHLPLEASILAALPQLSAEESKNTGGLT